MVDDHDDTLLSIRRLLEMLGHSVFTAGGLREALRVISRQGCDALLCDMALPDGLGMELLKRIPAAGRPSRAVAMSVYDAPETRRESREAGYGHFLVKPFSPSELAAALEGAGAAR